MNTPNPVQPKFNAFLNQPTYRVKDVVKLLHMSKSTVYSLVYDKQIPYVKIGCAIHFFKDDLVKWIDQNYQPGGQ